MVQRERRENFIRNGFRSNACVIQPKKCETILMEEKPMVRLLVVESDVEANFYKGALEDNGINALVKGMGDSAFGAALDGPDEIELYVYSEDIEESKAIIMDLLDEDGDEIPAWTCSCGEDVDEGFGVCWSCGADYDAASSKGTESE